MVLGILTSIAACPAIVGLNETVQVSQRKQMRQMHRSRKTNLVVSCNDLSPAGRAINTCFVVLRDHKLWIATNPLPGTVEDDDEYSPSHQGHLFQGYYFAHPQHQWGKKGEGYVSTISDDPPMLNWIYVDRDTHEIKYGTKSESEGHLLGPWNCTPVDKRATFNEWEGFCAVEEERGKWALYFDVDDDGLEDKVPLTKDLKEVELIRQEMRIPPVRQKDQGPPE